MWAYAPRLNPLKNGERERERREGGRERKGAREGGGRS